MVPSLRTVGLLTISRVSVPYYCQDCRIKAPSPPAARSPAKEISNRPDFRMGFLSNVSPGLGCMAFDALNVSRLVSTPEGPSPKAALTDLPALSDPASNACSASTRQYSPSLRRDRGLDFKECDVPARNRARALENLRNFHAISCPRGCSAHYPGQRAYGNRPRSQ